MHIILISLVLLSSCGFVISTHYCQNELKSISLYKQSENCHEDLEAKELCPLHAMHQPQHTKSTGKDDCCNDHIEWFQLDEEYRTETVNLQLQYSQFLIAVVTLTLHLELPRLEVPKLHYLNYKPPLLVYDIPVSLQTFIC